MNNKYILNQMHKENLVDLYKEESSNVFDSIETKKLLSLWI